MEYTTKDKRIYLRLGDRVTHIWHEEWGEGAVVEERTSIVPGGTCLVRLLFEDGQQRTFNNDLDNLKWPKIKEWDAIYLNDTVGELFPDPEIRQSLLRYVRDGGGVGGCVSDGSGEHSPAYPTPVESELILPRPSDDQASGTPLGSQVAAYRAARGL